MGAWADSTKVWHSGLLCTHTRTHMYIIYIDMFYTFICIGVYIYIHAHFIHMQVCICTIHEHVCAYPSVHPWMTSNIKHKVSCRLEQLSSSGSLPSGKQSCPKQQATILGRPHSHQKKVNELELHWKVQLGHVVRLGVAKNTPSMELLTGLSRTPTPNLGYKMVEPFLVGVQLQDPGTKLKSGRKSCRKLR